MKFVTFIIPLGAPVSYKNWDVISHVCNGTLWSISRQTSKNWQCILVCHEPPIDVIEINNLHILRMDYPPPTTYKECRFDKTRRLSFGFEYMKNNITKYGMCIDADDRIHENLVEYIETNDNDKGWRIAYGYEYEGGQYALKRNGKFDKLCGSSIIHPKESPKFNGYPNTIGHCHAQEYYESIGQALDIIPFYAAVRTTGYGENLSDPGVLSWRGWRRTAKRMRHLRLISKKELEKFGLISYPVPTRRKWRGWY